MLNVHADGVLPLWLGGMTLNQLTFGCWGTLWAQKGLGSRSRIREEVLLPGTPISLSNLVSFNSSFGVCSLVCSAEADERWHTLRGPPGFLMEFSCKGSHLAEMRGSDGNTRMQSKHKPSSCWIPWIMNVLVTLGTVRKELPRYFSSRYLALLFNLLHSPRLQSPIPTRKR